MTWNRVWSGWLKKILVLGGDLHCSLQEMISIFISGGGWVVPCCRLETWEENPTVSAGPGCWGLVQTDGDLWGTSLRNTLVKKDSWGVSSRRCPSGRRAPKSHYFQRNVETMEDLISLRVLQLVSET